MKFLVAIVVLGFWPHFGMAQAKDTSSNFKNAGDQEDYWAKIQFERNYSKKTFTRYVGEVVRADSNLFKYGDQTLKVYATPDSLRSIFGLGLFYSTIIYENGQMAILTSPGKDTMTISNLEELKFLRKPTCRRFRMLIYVRKMINPILSFIELTNDKATIDTPAGLFIQGALLTYFNEYSILI